MSNLYIDLKHAFGISKKSGKYNGGNNYSVRVTMSILSAEIKYNIFLLVDENAIDNIKGIFKEYKFETIKIQRLSELKLYKGDIYFAPLVEDSINHAKEIEIMKKANPYLKIYLTIHDMRHRENYYDYYDGLLKKGLKSNPIVLAVGRWMHARTIDIALKRIIKVADKIFTVSNYSMQNIHKLNRVKNINWYYQTVDFKDFEDIPRKRDKSILFVSAGRPEKNFVRALLAFEMYVKDKNDAELKLIVTGINDLQKANIKDKLHIDDSIWKRISFRGYVDAAELAFLYKSCRFLLFISKSEGFGLPIVEATVRGCPCVLSRVSSIPEVIGAAGIYVDPRSIQSICRGIEQLMIPMEYEYRLNLMKTIKGQVLDRMKLDSDIFVHELCN